MACLLKFSMLDVITAVDIFANFYDPSLTKNRDILLLLSLSDRPFILLFVIPFDTLYFVYEMAQWLQHLWDHGNLFETWVVQAYEVNHCTRSGSKWRYFKEIFFIFYTIIVC